MATETLVKQYYDGMNVYFMLRNTAGNYFDQDDNTFKALASCVDPYFEATERIYKAGADESDYVADIDLDGLAPGLAAVECHAIAVKRVGGSPDLAADEIISQPETIVAQLGQLGYRNYDLKFYIATKTTSGTTVQVWVELLADSALVALETIDPTAECTLEVKMHGNASQFTMNAAAMGAVNAAHRFEAEYTNPNFTADRGFVATPTITAVGLTISRDKTFTVVP